MTIAWTCSLPARPSPVTAALTSLGVWNATGTPARAASSATTPLTCAVPITVRTLCWLNTRSTATTSGRWSRIQRSTTSPTRSNRSPTGTSAGVRTTSTATGRSVRPLPESTTPKPHRVNPGSTPSTRTRDPLPRTRVRSSAGYPGVGAGPGRARRVGAHQCAASSQLRPYPTDTSRGTDSG